MCHFAGLLFFSSYCNHYCYFYIVMLLLTLSLMDQRHARNGFALLLLLLLIQSNNRGQNTHIRRHTLKRSEGQLSPNVLSV